MSALNYFLFSPFIVIKHIQHCLPFKPFLGIQFSAFKYIHEVVVTTTTIYFQNFFFIPNKLHTQYYSLFVLVYLVLDL